MQQKQKKAASLIYRKREEDFFGTRKSQKSILIDSLAGLYSSSRLIFF